ncbi:MAG: sulfite exporter TauE/SafE family protein [Coriobacteriales bacterium]|jgi:sulfite exporter TauE/SafE/copper chaperone CopZ|nr:sulfite exporter TauE/SafE family protein [Coriobacteriales bacterium]
MRLELGLGGMSCVACAQRIEDELARLPGVKEASVSYRKNQAVLDFDEDSLDCVRIIASIEALGYTASRLNSQTEQSAQTSPPLRDAGKKAALRVVGVLAAALALFIICEGLGIRIAIANFPLAGSDMGYGMVFVVGLLTSLHCLGMCGGINLSLSIPAGADTKRPALRSGFAYNFARVLSYTLIGALVGALGSLLSLSGILRGTVQIVAGLFMLIIGLNMVGSFAFLRRLLPPVPSALTRRLAAWRSSGLGAVVIGLLNGLMPCGPLQAMQLYALATASPFEGAFAMLAFGLGTLPLMLATSVFSSLLSRGFARVMMTVGAALVLFMGMFTVTDGLTLSGLGLWRVLPAPFSANDAAAGAAGAGTAVTADALGLEIIDGVQVVQSELKPTLLPSFTVLSGLPIRWTIDAPPGSINGCNHSITSPQLELEYAFHEGKNIIDLPPQAVGVLPYSCWMGMMHAQIRVIDANDVEGALAADTTSPARTTGEYRVYTDHQGEVLDIEGSQTDDQFIVLEIPFDKPLQLNDPAILLSSLSYTIGDRSDGAATLSAYPEEVTLSADQHTLTLVFHMSFAAFSGRLRVEPATEDGIAKALVRADAAGEGAAAAAGDDAAAAAAGDDEAGDAGVASVEFPQIDLYVGNGISLQTLASEPASSSALASVTKRVVVPSSATRGMVHLSVFINGEPIGLKGELPGSVVAHFHDYLNTDAATFASRIASAIENSEDPQLSSLELALDGDQITLTCPQAQPGDVIDLRIESYGASQEEGSDL